MRRFEIDKVRQMSQTGAVGRVAKYDMGDIKKGQIVPPKGPWVDWFAEMAKKTVMRRHSKTLPMSGDVLMSLGSEDEHELDPSLSTAAVLGSHAGSEPSKCDRIRCFGPINHKWSGLGRRR
jgi:recombinational DNA repair protein RecT